MNLNLLKSDGTVPQVEQRSLENPAVPLWSPAAYNYLGAPRSSAGVAVDRTTILQYPAVWRALTLVSHKIGRLPFACYKSNKDGGREVDSEHPATWLLSRRPSDLYTPFVYKSLIVMQAMLFGNSFSWIIRDDMGRPDELIVLDPETTAVVLDKGQLSYVVRLGQESRKLLPENVIHLKGLNYDGIIGVSVLNACREVFGLGIAQQRYTSVYFRNNGAPGPVVLKYPAGVKLDPEQAAKFRDEWSKIHTGLDNSHKMAIIGNGAELTQFSVDNNTAQLIESREFEVACGIANLFGIPPHKLGVDRATSYGSLESEERAFLNDTLDGWLCQMEDEFESKLLKESQLVRDSHFIEADRRSLEQADYKTRSESLIAECNNGLRSQNECRALLNLPSVGPDGDRLRIPVNITFADMVGGDDDTAIDDVALTDDPNPTAETTVGETDGQLPDGVEVDPVGNTTNPLRSLLSSVINRYIKRLRKAAVGASKGPDWTGWLQTTFDDHRTVMVEGIAPVGQRAADEAGRLADELRDELALVLPEQVGAVFDRIKTETWIRRML